MDAHIRERADRFYRLHDPEYRVPYQRLCEAVALQEKKGDRYALFGSRTAVVEQLETGRPLGVRDTFGLTGRSEMEHGRVAFPPGRRDALPPIRPEVNWDVKARLEDMDRAMVDINVLFPTHVSSYCALRDVGFENALYRAYHRWVADFCAQAPARLKWTVVANMRDIPSGVAEIKYWAERDPNLVGVYISPQAPGKKMLDNPDLYPLYDAAQSLDLPMLAHGGTARPP
jgi:predicted TIM-barrel fold metal-dependent hydrolase